MVCWLSLSQTLFALVTGAICRLAYGSQLVHFIKFMSDDATDTYQKQLLSIEGHDTLFWSLYHHGEKLVGESNLCMNREMQKVFHVLFMLEWRRP